MRMLGPQPFFATLSMAWATWRGNKIGRLTRSSTIRDHLTRLALDTTPPKALKIVQARSSAPIEELRPRRPWSPLVGRQDDAIPWSVAEGEAL